MASTARVTLAMAAVLAIAVLAWLWAEWLRLPDPSVLRDHNPDATALMLQRAREAEERGQHARRRQEWVPLKAISKTAVAAVLISEDASFYQHAGIDTVELQKALDDAWKRHHLGRGASTITQQLAKNLWLSTDRSVLRKLKELVLAKRLEAALPKSRILTIYLNVVEWGDGVYGIEAAAREHFSVHASELTPAQGAMLASMLPAPRRRLPRLKPVALHRHALLLIERLEAVGRLDAGQAQAARLELERFFGRSATPAEDLEDVDAPEPTEQPSPEASRPKLGAEAPGTLGGPPEREAGPPEAEPTGEPDEGPSAEDAGAGREGAVLRP